MTTKIYVSASWDDRFIAKEIARELEMCGYDITTCWWEHKHANVSPDCCDDKTAEFYCGQDIVGVQECDVFVMYNSGIATSGKYFEMGMTYDQGKKILTFGKPLTSVFRFCVDLHFNIESPKEIAEMIQLLV